ncbi:spore coat protein [Rossellomorea vietnamensis]|uniref:CotD family spore coat protein n=2 Tax=Rossellomorea vietnamensis TaxID=218284 RepID=UPI001CCD37DE|nr:CotD family spore coat protein [Rossellomorea vietnamensis]MCA0149617.1 spore coat protein [Rossellomorea vietnamensis]
MYKGQQNCHSGQCGYPQVSPAMQLPTKVMPAQYDPVKQFTENQSQEVQIPMVHPSHTTQVQHTHYKYIHSFPHTQSVVQSTSCEHVCAPCPPRPRHRRFW